MGIELSGNIALTNKLKNLPDAVQEEVEELIVLAIDGTYDKALLAAPTDQAGGVGIRGSAYKEVKGLEGEVGFKNRYAAYHEFGTGTKVDIPPGMEDYAMEFYVNGKGRLPANPFLFPAFFYEVREFNKELPKILKRVWDK